MQVFNYASYAKTIELGMTSPNMTNTAKVLLEPIISLEEVLNRQGNPYSITPKLAREWYLNEKDIPANIKQAAGLPKIIDNIGDYFADNIIDVVINQNKEATMYSELIKLINNSNLDKSVIEDLNGLYSDNERAEFLGRSFLYAIVGDNCSIGDEETADEGPDEDITKFLAIIKDKYKKPQVIQPPANIEQSELRYVEELYKVYHELTGDYYLRPEDLTVKQKRHFDMQRKDYYKAETIRRELRDVIRMDETDGFDLVKDEIYDGVITTRDRDYITAMDRLNSVIEHATTVSLSNNVSTRVFDWIGPGEKKGVCHMLVNDQRLNWVEENEHE